MMDTVTWLLSEVRFSLLQPRPGLRRMLDLNLPPSASWLILALMAVISAILTHLSVALIPVENRDILIDMMQSPIRTAILQAILLGAAVYMIFWIGRARGGKANLEAVVIAMAWLQLIMFCIQIAQLLVQALIPVLGAPVNLAGFAVFLWLLTNFVAEVHGFRSLPLVFGGILLGIVALAMALAILIAIFVGMPTP